MARIVNSDTNELRGLLYLSSMALFVAGCSLFGTKVKPHDAELKCTSVKVAYWQDKNATDHKYKVSYLCTLPDGATKTVTPLASETRIPAPKCR